MQFEPRLRTELRLIVKDAGGFSYIFQAILHSSKTYQHMEPSLKPLVGDGNDLIRCSHCSQAHEHIEPALPVRQKLSVHITALDHSLLIFRAKHL